MDTDHFCCFGCRFVHHLQTVGDNHTSNTTGTFFLRVGLGIFLTMNLMVFNWFFYSQHIYEQSNAPADSTANMLAGLFAYLMFALCTLVMLLVGSPIAIDVIERLRHTRGRRIDMNLLILVGVGAAYAISAVHTIRGYGNLYFDTAALILVLVTIGGYLDARARQRANEAGNSLIDVLPDTARVKRNHQTTTIDAGDLIVGDRVQVRAGESIPVDGIVRDGVCDINEAALTGESKPRTVGVGHEVVAGSISIDGQLWIEATQVGGDRRIEQVKRLLKQARQQQPVVQRIADRIASIFVPIVMALAATVLIVVSWQSDVETGLFRALSVLLISCPCALGLAAPLATSNALACAARQGILFNAAPILEKAAAVRVVAFDKTGTLTDPRIELSQVETQRGWECREAIRIAASIEHGTNHPIARGLCEEAARQEIETKDTTHVRIHAGRGVEGWVNGQHYRIGNTTWLHEARIDTPSTPDNGCLHVHLFDEEGIIATFHFRESIKPQTKTLIHDLREKHYAIQVLTGDESAAARRIKIELSVPVHAQLLPDDKLEHIKKIQQDTGPKNLVAFVGDGINDAPALAQADVGISVYGATQLASNAGHVQLIGGDIKQVAHALAMARDTVRRIKLNLFWAFSYNTIGLIAATAGLLTPVLAAVLMAGSSFLIIATSRKAGEIKTNNSARQVGTPHRLDTSESSLESNLTAVQHAAT